MINNTKTTPEYVMSEKKYTQYELYGTPYMGHLVRLVEILAKTRDRASRHQKNMGHLKKYVKGNGT